MTDKKEALIAANITLKNGTPLSNTFEDIYFSAEDGTAESRYNFIEGNQLPQRFSELSNQSFTIIETGFGTGLNFLLTAQLWQQAADSSQHLHYISTEKHPILAAKLAAIYNVNQWNNEITQSLLAAYPTLETGQYTLQITPNIRLVLLWGDSVAQLAQYDCSANAFFLDGFAPSKNPDMWSPDLFRLMRKRSAKHATFATFTAAGHVRRGLADAGFLVKKQKGFGRKRERLIGYLPDC